MQTNETTPAPGKTIGFYLVACIDLLGHSNELTKMSWLPTPGDDEARKAFLQILTDTYGRVNGFHQSFLTFFEEDSKNENRRLLDTHLPTAQIKFQRFMDAVFIYFPLSETAENKAPLSNVYRALVSCAGLFLLWLSEGVPIRGGIEIGVAFEPRLNEIYGPAVMRAYHLESKLAHYPRIIVGQELLNYLKTNLESMNEDPTSQLNKSLAQLCFGLLVTDLDGQVALDYLGEKMRKGLSDTAPNVIFEKAQRFVLAESEKHQKAKDTTLAIRYTMLRGYFASRQHLWQPDPASEPGPKQQ